jgi:hypothetical protein
VAVGGDVGAGVGCTVGAGVTCALGLGVALGVAVGPVGSVEFGGGEATGSLGIGGGSAGASEEVGDDSIGLPATPPAAVGNVDRPAPRFALVTIPGVPVAPATDPRRPNRLPITTARIEAATAMIPTTTGARRSVRRGVGRTFPRGTERALGTAIEAPHPGHGPAARVQHLSQAYTPHEGHIFSPIPRSIAAGPIRFPHRSQNGMDGPPDGGIALGPFN